MTEISNELMEKIKSRLNLKPMGEDKEGDIRNLEYFLKKFIEFPCDRSKRQLLLIIESYDIFYSKQSLLNTAKPLDINWS